MGGLSHTVSGDIASFRTPSRVPIESLKFHFLPKQAVGTPSPENPIPIEGWSGLELVSGNKNLFDPLLFINRNANGLTSEVLPNGKIHFYGTCTSTIRYAQPSGKYFTLPPGTYCVKGSPNNIRLVDEDGNQTNTSGATIITLTRTTSFSLGIRGVTTQTPLDFEEEIMVARADSAVDWVKYESPFGAENLLPFDAVEVGSYDTTGGKIQEGNAVYRRLSVTLDPGIYAFITDTANCHLVRILINDATNQTDRDGKVFRIELTKRSTVKICWRNTSSTEITAALNNRIERRMLPLVFPTIGKNKFDEANAEWVEGRLISNTGSSAIDQRYKYCDTYIPILPNTQYTFSLLKGTQLNAGFTVPYYDKDKNFVSRDVITAATTDKDIIFSGTVTTPANAYYARMSVPNSSLTTEIQIELGDTRTSYEAYSANNTVYGGYIDPVAGEIVAEYYLAKAKKSDFGNKSTPSGTGRDYRQTQSIFPKTASGVEWATARQQQKFNRGIIANPWSGASYGENIGIIATQDSMNPPITYMRISEEVYQAMNDDDYAEISYKLREPIHIPISAEDMKAFLDHNNFWSDANDITEVTYAVTESKHILAVRKRMMSQIWDMIPLQYQAVEYLSAKDSNPYIDMGIQFVGECEAEVHYYNDKNEAFLFGVRKGSGNSPYCNFNVESASADRSRFDYGNRKATASSGLPFAGYHDGEYIFKFHGRTATMEKVSTGEIITKDYGTLVRTDYPDYNMYLFSVNTAGTPSLNTGTGELRIYSAKFWLGGQLVRDFVPCIRKSDNELGMYDRVSKVFFANAGSGNFTSPN